MASKTKINIILKALNDIRESLPISQLEQLMEDIRTDILEPIEDKLDVLVEKDRLTERQEARQSDLEDIQSEWETVIGEIESYKDTLDEIENLIDSVQEMEE